MTDQEKLAAMRKLGVRWPRHKTLPTYPATMTLEQKGKADGLYDSMSQSFVDSFGPRP